LLAASPLPCTRWRFPNGPGRVVARAGNWCSTSEPTSKATRGLRNQLGLLPADQIRTNREELSLTQRQLAERLGVTVETISRWETGALTQSRGLDRCLRVYFGVPAVRVALDSNDAFPSRGVEVQS
jgi:DNA-binding XRE family transcriptional regulator